MIKVTLFVGSISGATEPILIIISLVERCIIIYYSVSSKADLYQIK